MGNSTSTKAGTDTAPAPAKRDLLKMVMDIKVPESELIQISPIEPDQTDQVLFNEVKRLRDVLEDITRHGEAVHKAYLEQRVAFTAEDTAKTKEFITELTGQMVVMCREFMKDLTLLKGRQVDPKMQRFRNEQSALLSKKFQTIYQDFKNRTDTGRQKYESALSFLEIQEIQERHQEILKLENQLLELNTMFLDMAVLVDAQAPVVDRIEENTGGAHVKLTKAREEMHEAHQNQKSARSKRICIGFWSLFVVGIIVIIILLV
jgi:t-SNARE complex subunit (syntaxin)